jgi:hypothetical protein
MLMKCLCVIKTEGNIRKEVFFSVVTVIFKICSCSSKIHGLLDELRVSWKYFDINCFLEKIICVLVFIGSESGNHISADLDICWIHGENNDL